MKGLWVPAASSMAGSQQEQRVPSDIGQRKASTQAPRRISRCSGKHGRLAPARAGAATGPSRRLPATRARTSCESTYSPTWYSRPRPGAQSGHRLQERSRLRQRVGPEENPADRDDQQRVEMPDRRPERIDHAAGLHPLEHQERAVEEPPAGERPACAMPEPAQEEDSHQIGIIPNRRATIAPQRNIEVIAKPGRERDVPASPEFGDRAGRVGIVEIFKEIDAEELG